ncbi:MULTISPECIES: carbon-nitrogen hydrolase family protein [unclassified Candidatus Frackibacter]|uniref:carbon-nitrogen hydrolase family protein n=1 Tax=unclassified Candidatus Frackibacter TaxID=2648818 RepID=UPI000791F22A|nr:MULTISPECIES: carbon-nitrogen hydrolase family protein [unclassified Candidatus Frackibacter]KXS45275.1 MAG: nitrilase/cyanide hydratase and apolipoprotein N-acyltransferase [Candidatus Frackibacter sp. T328-2]SDC79098.1 Predicted amidohydrolase [Candidatus Frackibacter sp. WG11]SEM91855.1 Predicted amidohydrolase [Candidatus Frackibacter sp. WG12]SFM01625.1 Predicted amidohydrolase [Candidatus Frackibacter sp. WG13]
MKKFVAAGVQIAIKPNDVEANLAKVVKWIDKAVDEYDAELIVFPEDVTTGFDPAMSAEELYELVSPIPGKVTEPVEKAAKEHGVYVALPTYEQGEEPGIVYNSVALIGPEGVVGVYRKTHPFPTERLAGGGWATPGDKAEVFDTELGKIGMILCYDGDFPELSRLLAVKGAEIIIRPAALLRSFDIWEMTNMARAYDNHVYMISVNAVGPDAGNNYNFGHSMIVSPIAQKLAQARGVEEIIAVELDDDPIKNVSYGTKSPMIFDHLEDRNVGLYKDILKEAKSQFEPAKRIPYKKTENK